MEFCKELFLIISFLTLSVTTDEFGNNFDLFLNFQHSFLMRIVQNKNFTSKECQNDLQFLSKNFETYQEWALKMFDASGRPNAGFISGYLSWTGSMMECLQIIVPKTIDESFEAKYCQIQTRNFTIISGGNLSKAMLEAVRNEVGRKSMIPFRIGICVPSTCTENDLIAATNMNKFKEFQGNINCSFNRTTELSIGFYIMMCLCTILLILTILGTFFESKSSKNDAFIWNVLEKFSLPKNIESIVDTAVRYPESLRSLDGIRFFSVCWIILIHTYSFMPLALYSTLDKEKEQTYWNAMFEAVTAGSFAVDSFFLISGFLLANRTLKEFSKSHKKFKLYYFYFHRWWRIVPTYMLVLGLTTAFSPYLINGPFQVEMIKKFGDCASNWWTNLLFINNFVNIDRMCFSHSWYLACDMQIFLISPIILYPLHRWPMVGLSINALFLMVSMITPAVLTAINNYPLIPSDASPQLLISYYQNIYMKPYCRMVPYCIGIFLGYSLFQNKNKFRISRNLNIIGWFICTLTTLGLIYGVNSLHKYGFTSIILSVAYAGLSKLIWSLIIAWIIASTLSGNAGYVNSLLSWKALTPLSKLSYILYLIHPAILYINNASIQSPVEFSHFNMVKLFLAVFMIALATSFVVSVIIEIPFKNLESIIFQHQKVSSIASTGEKNENLKGRHNETFKDENGMRL